MDPPFAVLLDVGNPPLLPLRDNENKVKNCSCGPNGVYINNTEDRPGDDTRYNLFCKDDETTMAMLRDYISFRNQNISAMSQRCFEG